MTESKLAPKEKVVLGRNIASGLASQGFGIALSLLTAPIIIRGLGATNYGLWNIALTIGGWVGFVNMIFSTSLVNYIGKGLGRKDPALCIEAERAISRWACLYAVAAAIILVILTPLMADRVLHVDPDHRTVAAHILLAQAAYVFFAVLASIGGGVVAAHQRLDISNGLRMAGAGLQSGGAAALILAGHGVEAVVWWVAVAQGLEGAALWFFGRRLQPKLDRAVSVDMRLWTARLVDYGGTLFSGYISGQLMFPMSRFLLGVFRPVAEVAYVTVPATLAGNVRMPSTNFAGAILTAVSTKAGEDDQDGLRELYLHGLRWTWLAVGPLTGIVMVMGGDFISAWISRDFGANAGPLVPLMTFGAGIHALAGIPSVLAQGLGKPRVWAIVNFVTGLINVSCSWWLIRVHGAMGAVVAMTISNVICTYAMLEWANREVGSSWAEIFRTLDVRVLIVTVSAATLCVLWRPPLPLLASVLVRGVVAGIFLICSTPWWLKKDELDWSIGMVRSLIKR